MIEREYYPLAIAAEAVGCSENDLIHLGARGRLDIYAIPSSFSVLTIYKSDNAEAELLTTPVQPLKIAIESIRNLEAGNTEQPIELCKSGGFYYGDFFAKWFVKEEDDDGIPLPRSNEDRIKMHAVSPCNSYKRVILKNCRLIILAADVQKLSELTSTQSKTEVDSRNYASNQLKVLDEASVKFWNNAIMDEKDTWPNTTDVIDWLKNNNYSDSLAKKAASIIRPEWAGAGRKPEE